MSEQQWSPVEPPREPVPATPPPPYGGPVPPPPGLPYGSQPGWTPPPKPGLLPLRPLSFGALLGAPFQTIRRNPAPTFGSGLLVNLVATLVGLAVIVPIAISATDRILNAAPEDQDTIAAGSVAVMILASLVTIAVSLVGGAFLQGVIVQDVARGTLGERARFGELWRGAARRAWPLIGWSAILGAAVLLVVALVVLLIVLGALIAPAALVAAITLAVLIGLGLIVLSAWLGVKLIAVPSVIVLERAGIAQAVRRSWSLTSGRFWPVFGVNLLVQLIVNVAAQVVTTPVSFLGGMLIPLLDPTGSGAGAVIGIAVLVLALVIGLVVGSITMIVQAALSAVITIDLRMRKEGLDLELQRVVEERSAGRETDDPFARVPAWASGPPSPEPRPR